MSVVAGELLTAVPTVSDMHWRANRHQPLSGKQYSLPGIEGRVGGRNRDAVGGDVKFGGRAVGNAGD